MEDEEEDMEILVNRVDYGYIPDAVTLSVLQFETKQDKTLVKLTEDIKVGKLRPELEKSYKNIFAELSVLDGVVLREERLLIPESVRADILALSHEGHPGMVSMLQQLRESVWWPGITKDVEEYAKTCEVGCAAASARNTPPTMVIRETPDKPWQHCSADYKGPIGGKYYLHVLIDNYSRFPEVKMTKSTSMDKLYPVLDEVFGVHGVPETITHDNGPPYNSSEWRKYSRECGFKSLRCSPEHPEGNGIAERFMGVLVKIIHAAMAEGKDPRIEVQRRLLNYRNTPHPSTSVSPASLMFNRKIRTKIPAVIKPSQAEHHVKAREKDAQTRLVRKQNRDKRRRAKDIEYKLGDKVLMSQKKSTVKPPFDPKPYTVIKVKGNQVTGQRGMAVKIRNKAKFKLLKPRPERLKPRLTKHSEAKDESDDDWYEGAGNTVENMGHATPEEELAVEQDPSSEDRGAAAEDDDDEEASATPYTSPIASRLRNRKTQAK